MRTSKWMVTAALLASLSAAAQQAADSTSAAQAPAPDASQTSQPSQPATSAPAQAASTAAQPAESQPAPTAQALPPTTPAPTTMEDVVNLFIEREHGLIKMLSNRTPVVETYLQNLTPIRNSARFPARITIFSAAWIWAQPSTVRII